MLSRVFLTIHRPKQAYGKIHARLKLKRHVPVLVSLSL